MFFLNDKAANFDAIAVCTYYLVHSYDIANYINEIRIMEFIWNNYSACT